MEKKIALLIDAENTSVKYLDSIFMELRNYGTITYKRMYGDFTSKSLSEWNHKALSYAIVPIQQPRYSAAKNAADIMLVIDAMDILYTNNVDIFCIVSSDSDFTRLVNRLCDDGMEVIGMGKSDASKTLKAACTIFKNLEIIYDGLDDESESEQKVSEEPVHKTTDIEKNIVPLAEIKKSMMEIVRENENQNSQTGLGGLKSSIQRLYKDFDERNYGYNSMTKFVSNMEEFSVSQKGSTVYVSINRADLNEKKIENFIRENVKKGAMDLGHLGRKIHTEYPDFDVKSFGYSQLGTFIQSIDGIIVEKNRAGTGKTARLEDGKR